MNNKLEGHRNKVLELASKGNSNQSNISKILDEYKKCLADITSILKKHGKSLLMRKTRRKIQTLSLAKECHTMKLELLTNATVVE
ncbi:MAG: hypothetical protein WBQ25_11530 [Nitrososphaeraceae archaeon]